MEGLVAEMTDINPTRRPPIEDVVAKFSCIRESLSESKLRSPMTSKRKPSLFSMFQRAKQALRSVRYIFSQKAVIQNAERDTSYV